MSLFIGLIIVFAFALGGAIVGFLFGICMQLSNIAFLLEQIKNIKVSENFKC